MAQEGTEATAGREENRLGLGRAIAAAGAAKLAIAGGWLWRSARPPRHPGKFAWMFLRTVTGGGSELLMRGWWVSLGDLVANLPPGS